MTRRVRDGLLPFPPFEVGEADDTGPFDWFAGGRLYPNSDFRPTDRPRRPAPVGPVEVPAMPRLVRTTTGTILTPG